MHRFTLAGHQDRWPFLLLALLSLAGIAISLFATRAGGYLSGDSANYIGAARNFLAGQGLTLPFRTATPIVLPHFPPFYALLLALPGALGVDLMEAARWVNALLFGGTIALVGLTLYRSTAGSAWAALLGAWLVLTSETTLSIHAMALSEASFIFLGNLGLALLAAYLETDRARYFVAAGVAVALAFFTRYAGGSLVLAAVLALALLRPALRPRNLAQAGAFGVLGSSLAALWMLQSAAAGNDNRLAGVSLYPLGDRLVGGLRTVVSWALPVGSLPVPLLALLGAALGLLAAWGLLGLGPWRGGRTAEPGRWLAWLGRHLAGFPVFIKVHMLFIFSFAAFLLAAAAFVDTFMRFDFRILSPLFVSLVVVLVYMAWRILSRAPGRAGAFYALAAVLLFFAGSYGLRAVDWVRDVEDFQAVGLRRYADSALLAEVEALPPETPIASNGDDVIYLFTGRPAWRLPVLWFPVTSGQNPRYQASLAAMQRRLEAEGGVLVYFYDMEWRGYLPTEAELQAQMPLRLVWRSADGAIYRVSSTRSDAGKERIQALTAHPSPFAPSRD